MLIKVGITGGIGSGKSVVSRLLGIMGIPVYISDSESKRLTQTDSSIREGLIGVLGDCIYLNGQLNKSLLASYMFGNPEHVKQVNGIIHPCVRNDFRAWIASQKEQHIVGLESAILVEAGFEAEVDVVIMVYAPQELRLRRAMFRDMVSEQEICRRIQSQMDDEEKRLYANYVVYNDGEQPLIPQIEKILANLQLSLLS